MLYCKITMRLQNFPTIVEKIKLVKGSRLTYISYHRIMEWHSFVGLCVIVGLCVCKHRSTSFFSGISQINGTDQEIC